MIELDDFVDGNCVKVGDECRKLKTWTYVTEDFCVRGEGCDSKLMLIFEDGSRQKVNNNLKLENC